ncbi:Protein-histidine N-methyltransferase [Aphelenchoides bicaudatus]|nr:Protein-histidine N-methyltransferase [Aphelenchoides bicaudatus]
MAQPKLSDKRISELSNLWTSILAEPPPQNLNKLWEEHLNIREVLEVSNDPFNFREAFQRPDRKESIEELLKWLDANQVDHGAVEIRPVENGYGLYATKDLEPNSIPIQLPHKLMLSLDYSSQCADIKKMHESDWVLSSMSNVNLAMIIAYTLLSNDKHFTPYLNALPSSHQTPLFFSKEELLSLKPSPIFESSLFMFRAVSRHYVYFVLRIVKDSVLKKQKVPGKAEFNFKQSPFNSDKFTFDLYRWCVSTVATRLNNVPSLEYKREDGSPEIIPALIPLIDFANYENKERGSASMILDGKSETIQLQLSKEVKAGEEVFLNYGLRSNGDFLLHNGFVPTGKNAGTFYEIKFGFPKTNESVVKQQQLQARNIRPDRGVYTFMLDYNSASQVNLEETALWHFALIFVATDPQDVDSDENKQKAIKFLLQRVQLLQRAYGELPDVEDSNKPLIDRFIWRLKKSEVELLRLYEEKFAQIQF